MITEHVGEKIFLLSYFTYFVNRPIEWFALILACKVIESSKDAVLEFLRIQPT